MNFSNCIFTTNYYKMAIFYENNFTSACNFLSSYAILNSLINHILPMSEKPAKRINHLATSQQKHPPEPSTPPTPSLR